MRVRYRAENFIRNEYRIPPKNVRLFRVVIRQEIVLRKLFLITSMYIQGFSRKAVWMIFLAFGLLSALFCYLFVYRSEPYLALNETAYSQVVLTLVFMMMGIELKREQRRENLDDIIVAYSKNAVLIPWAQVLAIGFLDLLTTILAIAVCFIRMAIDGAPGLWIGQSLAYIALLYFLPCWVLGIWGLLISQWNKGKSVYLPAMLVWILTSSLLTYITYYVDAAGLGIGRFFFNALNMGINNFHVPGNFLTGAPIELPRWIVRIGILVLLTALFLCVNLKSLASTRQKKRRAWVRTSAVIICGVAVMALFCQRYNVFFTRFANPEDSSNYVSEKDCEYISGKPVSLTDFPTEKKITPEKTDIMLSCTTQGISAEVTIEAVINSDSAGQAFTLYSDLIVDEVRVDGKKAGFERSNDGLMVHFPVAKKAGDKVAFVFRYHGYSLTSFPANETTVQLNRSFPWIPWPGIKTSTIYDNYYDYNESEDFFIDDWQRGDKVEYTLRYNGPGNLYTNLEEKGNNLYTGVSDNGVSLYSGMFHCLYREVDVYVPAFLHMDAHVYVDALLDAYEPLQGLCERMGTIEKPIKPRSIVVIPLRYPIQNGIPQEPYSWGNEWEIRQRSESSSTIFARKHADSLEEYQRSDEVTAKMTVAYILNPCTGYPIDVPHSSTTNFAAWLNAYIRVHGCDESDLEQYVDLLKENCSGNDHDIINGIVVPEIPLTKVQKDWISVILKRMHDGENFDEPFKAMYHRLLRGEAVTAPDIVTLLYNYHQGD